MTADSGDGTTWTEQLHRAAVSGAVLDLAPDAAEDESDPPDAGDGFFTRQIPAEDIRAVLLEPGLRVDPRGLQIRGAFVAGTLDVDHAKLPCRLVFVHCRFENHPSFEQTILPDLVLEDVALPGLSLRSARLTGDCILTGLRSSEAVDARNIVIGGRLDLTGAELINPEGGALILDGADIAGEACLKGLVATGEVRAHGARIGGQLGLQGAKLSNPEGKALHLDQADVTGGAFLNDLLAAGEVRAPGAHISGPLGLQGAKLSNPDGKALNLSGATLDALTLDDALTVKGRTDLSFVSIRILSVGGKRPATGLPPLSSAHGWTLGTVHGFLRTDCKSARVWLDTINTQPATGGRKEFSSQPWKEIAKIYDQIGQTEDARRFRFWAAQRTTRVAPWTSKLVRWPYAVSVRYGYYPLFAFGWLAAFWVTALILISFNASAFTPTDFHFATTSITVSNRTEAVRVTGATNPPPDNYPPFSAGLYAVDTAIPAASTGQSDAWRITGNNWLPRVFAVIKGLAWVFTALLLAGVTGILRKD